MSKEVVLIDGVRTPIGKFLGRVSQFSATELGAHAIKALKERNNLSGDDIDEVIMGNVVQAGVGQAPARIASINGGISASVPAFTINKVCGSGLKAVINAAQAIKCGDADAIIAGGMESMSNAPFLVQGARKGIKFGDQRMVDAMIRDGLWDAFNDHHMGNSAEYTAEKGGVSREWQDEFAYSSHQKAQAATEGGAFKDEMIPLQDKEGPIDRDESIRPDTTLDLLGKLRTAFVKEGGTVTAGNAPGLNDGASVLLVASAEEAQKRGWKPMAKIVDYAVAGTEPIDLFFAPVFSTQKLMKKMGVDVGHFDLIEVNEAFAAQTLADGKQLDWDWERVNVNGGAIALGHPIGASGARILTTLIWAMKHRGKKTGLATICMGGGNGISLAVEAL